MPLDSGSIGFDADIASDLTGVKFIARTGIGGYSTQNDVYRVKLHIKDEDDDLFAFVTSATVAITNGVTGTSALGYRSYIGQNVGTFEGSGSVEALFQSEKAINAIHENKSAYFNVICVAKDTRQGTIFDIPECVVAGQPTVELDSNILLPMDLSASEDPKLKYTISVCMFAHVPELADDL